MANRLVLIDAEILRCRKKIQILTAGQEGDPNTDTVVSDPEWKKTLANVSEKLDSINPSSETKDTFNPSIARLKEAIENALTWDCSNDETWDQICTAWETTRKELLSVEKIKSANTKTDVLFYFLTASVVVDKSSWERFKTPIERNDHMTKLLKIIGTTLKYLDNRNFYETAIGPGNKLTIQTIYNTLLREKSDPT